jgi:hypothetical protein
VGPGFESLKAHQRKTLQPQWQGTEKSSMFLEGFLVIQYYFPYQYDIINVLYLERNAYANAGEAILQSLFSAL